MRLLLASGLIGVLLGAATGEPASPVLTLGVLRRDAIVVPFATFDGSHWKNQWPGPGNDPDVPMNLSSVPRRWWGPTGPIASWQVWAGPQPQTVRVRQPDWLKTYCQKQIGLRTDYQPRVRPPEADTQPYPKDGLAVWPPQTVEPIEHLAPNSHEAAGLGDLLRGVYAAQTDRAVKTAEQQGANVHPDMKALENLPIVIESLYAIGTTRRVYWIESSREYKGSDGCAVLFGRGWMIVDSGTLTSGAFVVEMVPCNRETLVYMLPLGLITLPTGTYWIAQWSGWEREDYGIFRIGEKSIDQELAVHGGTCVPN